MHQTFLKKTTENFCKLAQHAEKIRKNVRENSNDAYLLSVRVQTTINQILICFLPQYQHELKKALRETLTRGAWYGLNNGKLAAIVSHSFYMAKTIKLL